MRYCLTPDLIIRFARRLLRHTTGDWYGAPFRLAPWQEEAIREIYGRVDEEGRRRVRLAYLELPKKSGKTEFGAALAVATLCLDRAPQIYIAAAGLRQTMNVFRACTRMVELEPELARRLLVLRGTNRIVRRDDRESFIQAVAADGDLTDGVNPTLVIADELHRWRTRKQMENWDVLLYGGIARRESLVLAMTTAGSRDESPLAWRLHERAVSGVDDPSFFGRVWAAPPGTDWRDERVWLAANPSLEQNGGFLPISRIREAFHMALGDPAQEAAFRRYYLNVWDDREDRRAIDMDMWDACAGDWAAAGWPEIRSRNDLLRRWVDRPCWVGVDISMTTDMSAVTLVFDMDDHIEVVPFYWLPEAGVDKRERYDGMPYRAWSRMGFVELCAGQVIDLRLIEDRIRWAAEMFDVREIAFDPWNSRTISVRLVDEGFRCSEVRQTFAGLNAATKRLLELISLRRLQHGGHPVLRWNAQCMCLQSDRNDLVKPARPERERSRLRIDGISALVTALARMIASSETAAPVKVAVL